MKKKKARIQHTKEFPPFNEGYLVEIEVNGKWEFESFFEIRHDTFIHQSIMDKFLMLHNLGYHISFT